MTIRRALSFGRRTAVLLVAGIVACVSPRAAGAGDLYDLDAGREALITAAGLLTGLGAARLAADQPRLTAADVAALDASRLNALDRIATRRWSPSAARVSDVLQAGMVAGPLLLSTQAGDGAATDEILGMYGETLLVNVAAVGLLKSVTGRVRPYAYNDDPSIPPSLKRSQTTVRSFPSGHAALTFGAAVFTGEVYARLNPDDPGRHWVRGGSLALAATTAYLRVRAGRHFPTDVLAGAVIGSVVGWAVPRVHEVGREAEDRTAPPPALLFSVGF